MKKQKRPSKFSNITTAVTREWAHANSAVIFSRQRVLTFELGEAEKSLVALAAAAAHVRGRRAEILAVLTGLSAVIEKR